MKSRIKLYLILVLLSFISVLLGLAVAYYQTRSLFLEEFHSKASSVASTIAALTDPKPILSFNTPEDATLPSYLAMREKLRHARDSNQREDLFVVYVYIIKPSPHNRFDMVLAISAANSPEETKPIGHPYQASISYELRKNLDKVYSPKDFVTDEWGTWLKAFSPIYDLEGKYVATVGVEISANYIENQLNNFFLMAFYALLVALSLGLISAMFVSKKITSSFSVITNYVKDIAKGNFGKKIELQTNDEFGELAKSINTMSEELNERETLKKSFARYVSSHVLEKTLEVNSPINLEGERKKISVLFCDIRDFNKVTETYLPEDVVQILNGFFAKMLDIIFKYKGTLDKYLWDGVMVEFGIPNEDPEHEKHALMAALEMKKSLAELSEILVKNGKSKLEVGIGVHTGMAVVGNIGSEKRMEYTAIGDTVNVASRLQVFSKTKGVTIVCSEETYQGAKDAFVFKELGDALLPGRVDMIKTYTVEAK